MAGSSLLALIDDIASILDDVSVIDLASESSIAVREATLQWTELLAADEVFVTSTIREVVSVVMVDDHVVGDGKPGVMAGALRRALRHRTGAR